MIVTIVLTITASKHRWKLMLWRMLTKLGIVWSQALRSSRCGTIRTIKMTVRGGCNRRQQLMFCCGDFSANVNIATVFQEATFVLKMKATDHSDWDLEHCVVEGGGNILSKVALEPDSTSNIFDREVDEV